MLLLNYTYVLFLNSCLFLQRNGEIQFWEAECLKIDPKNHKVICRSLVKNLVGQNDFSLEYDHLVVAVGAQVNTFDTPGVVEHCHFLKVDLISMPFHSGLIAHFL